MNGLHVQDPFQTATLSKSDGIQPLETGSFSSLLISVPHYDCPIEEVRTAGGWDRCVRKRLGPHSSLHSASNIATIHLSRPGYHILKKKQKQKNLGLVALFPCFDLVFVHFYLCPNMLSTGVRNGTFLTLALCRGPRSIMWFAHGQAGIHPQSEKRGSTLA